VGSSFPYLEKGLKGLWQPSVENAAAPGTNGGAERTKKQEHEMGY